MSKLILTLTLTLLTITARAQTIIGQPLRPLSSAAVNTNTLNDDLVAYWKMDEASGTRVDSGSNGLDLTDTGSPGSATGIITNAVDFVPASNQSLTHVDDPLLDPGDTDFTFAFWVYPDFTGFARVVFGKYAAANREYYVRHVGGGNQLEFGVSGNGTSDTLVTSGNLAASGQWYFCVVWHDATANTINIQVNNAAPASAGHATGCFNGTAEFSIGRDVDISNNWDGRIDEFGYWSRVLTADERTYLYNAGAARTCCPYP